MVNIKVFEYPKLSIAFDLSEHVCVVYCKLGCNIC